MLFQEEPLILYSFDCLFNFNLPTASLKIDILNLYDRIDERIGRV